MQPLTQLALQNAPSDAFERHQAANWVANRGARLDALLKRAMAKQEIVRIHRGLYALSNRYLHKKLDPLALAQRVHGPSYLSLETALAFHGWIPEGVQTLASVCSERSRTFSTPLGFYSFTRVPQKTLFEGVRRIESQANNSFFVATPLKALADLVYVQRQDWSSAAPLIGSLRVEEEFLASLEPADFDEVLAAYKPGRVVRFLKGLRKDLGR